MENVVSIVNTRENPLEFDISIQGVDDNDTTVKFVIETNPVHFSFICHKEDGKWVVVIPPLPHIERVSYNFHLEIVVDGYYFEPYRGTLNVTAEPEVTAAGVHKGAPMVAPVVNSVEVREDDSDITDDEFKSLADKIINKHKNKQVVKEKAEPVKKKAKVDKAKDKVVKEAIAKFKNTPLKIEVIEESGAKKAYDMGLDDGKSSRPKKDAEKSFGPYAKDYYKGYDDGKSADDAEAWKEKTAAKRKGRMYHESDSDTTKPKHKSNLAGALEKLEESPELSEQAKKVRDIVGTTKH